MADQNEKNDKSDKRKQSLSWVVQRAWKLAKSDIREIPSVNDIEGDEEV